MSHYANDRQMFQYDEPQHLNGPAWNNFKDRVKKGAHEVANAGKATSSVVSAWTKKKYDASVAKYHEVLHHNKKPITTPIDICECSRRVQGHLAIQYPEFH